MPLTEAELLKLLEDILILFKSFFPTAAIAGVTVLV